MLVLATFAWNQRLRLGHLNITQTEFNPRLTRPVFQQVRYLTPIFGSRQCAQYYEVSEVSHAVKISRQLTPGYTYWENSENSKRGENTREKYHEVTFTIHTHLSCKFHKLFDKPSYRKRGFFDNDLSLPATYTSERRFDNCNLTKDTREHTFHARLHVPGVFKGSYGNEIRRHYQQYLPWRIWSGIMAHTAFN